MMYKKTFIAFIVGFALLASSGAALADADTLPDAGLTPDSPFYFLDRVGDWARVNVFFFSPARKAKAMAEVAEERLAELKEIIVNKPGEIEIIKELRAGADKMIERANSAVEVLGGKKKPVAELLEKLEELSLKRQAAFEKVMELVPEEIREDFEDSFERSFELAEKRRELLMEQAEEGLVSKEEFGRMSRERMKGLKEMAERHRKMAEGADESGLRDVFMGIAGRNLDILEDDIFSIESRDGFDEIRKEVSKAVKEAIDSVLEAREYLEGDESISDALKEMREDGRMDIKERAEEMIEKAEEQISETEEDLGESEEGALRMMDPAKTMLSKATEHLKIAKTAFEGEKYGEAFGAALAAYRQARAAERTAEKMLVREIREFERAAEITPEKMKEFLKEKFKEDEMEDLEKIFEDMPEDEMKEMMEEKMRGMERMPFFKKDADERVERHEREVGEDIACPQIYEPVCGEDGKTYSNKCVAEGQKGIDIKHEGGCRVKVHGEVKLPGLDRGTLEVE